MGAQTSDPWMVHRVWCDCGRFWGPGQIPVHVSVLERTRKQHGATALGGAQGQLLEGTDLASSLEDVAWGMAVHTKCIQPPGWAPPGHGCHQL